MKKPRITGPLDGTPAENLKANQGIWNYPLGIPITDILKQIRANEQRERPAKRP